MTSALRGEGGLAQKKMEEGRLREFSAVDQSQMQTRGEGFQNPENFADVIYGRPLTVTHFSVSDRDSTHNLF